MRTKLYILLLCLLEIGMLAGCSADGIPEKTDDNRPEGLTYIRFNTKAESGENTLQNLTVLQFDLDEQVTDETEQKNAKCVTARYLRSPEKETDQEYYLIGLQASTKDNQYLVFIANAGSTFQNYSGTLGDFKAKTIDFDQKTNNGESQLMLGAKYVPVKGVDDENTYEVELKRLVAQVHFKYTKSLEVRDADFSPVSLRLRNVPKVLKYADGITEATDYPAREPANFMDYTPIISQIEDGFTWYIPQNVWSSSSTLSDDKAFRTYVELSGIYKAPNMPDQLVTYQFYIGKEEGYNVKRNYKYEILPVLKGVNSFDENVTRRNLTISPSANCFVVAPASGNELTFNPHTAPGTDVDGTEVRYASQVVEDRYSRISTVKTVWQTADNLINVTFADGMVRVVPNANGVEGNALIAAYAADDVTILWSWHIWVTPYAKVLNGTGPNGYIHEFGNFEWMDRNLGALNTYREDKNRNLYYQWGRKDPFYDTQKDTSIASLIKAENKGTALNIGESVKCPAVFFTNQSQTGTWHGGTAAIPTLWSPDTKTVFDPCPAGWRVPVKAGWEACFKSIVWDTANPYGYALTINAGTYSWFPRGALANSNMVFNTNTYMWSAEWNGSCPQTYTCSTSIVNNIAGSNGGSVRCVKVK